MSNESTFTVDTDSKVITDCNGNEYIFINEEKQNGEKVVVMRLKSFYIAEQCVAGNIFPDKAIEHIDGDKTNYDISNLRTVPRTSEHPPFEFEVREIKRYPNLYLIGSNGFLVSLRSDRIVKQDLNEKGYPVYTTRLYGKKIRMKIHIETATSFVANPENKPQVNHLDCIKTNGDFTNLEWVTNKENVSHAYENNLITPLYGERVGTSTISDEKRLEIADYVSNHTFKETAQYFNVSLKVVRVSRKFKERLDAIANGEYFQGKRMV